MGSDVGSRVLGAMAGAVTVECMDKLLDKVGLTDDHAHLPRVAIKAAASAVIGIAVVAILDRSPDQT